MNDYEFRVKGRLSRELLATFAPLRVEADSVETVLVGPIVDRAQLHGVIARFETLSLELVGFRVLPRPQDMTRHGRGADADVTTSQPEPS